VVSADGSAPWPFLWALAGAGDLSPEGLWRFLYGERTSPPHPAAPRIKHVLSRLELACRAGPAGLPNREGRPRWPAASKDDRAGLSVRRPSVQRATRQRCQSRTPRDHRNTGVADLKSADPLANGLERFRRQSQARCSELRSRRPPKNSRSPERLATHQMPSRRIGRRCVEPDQQILVTDGGFSNRLERERRLRSRRRLG